MTDDLLQGAARQSRCAYGAQAACVAVLSSADCLSRAIQEDRHRGRPYCLECCSRVHGLPECPLGWARWGTSFEISQPMGQRTWSGKRRCQANANILELAEGGCRVHTSGLYTLHCPRLQRSGSSTTERNPCRQSTVLPKPRCGGWPPGSPRLHAQRQGAQRAPGVQLQQRLGRSSFVAHAGAAGAQPLPSRRLDPDGPCSCTAAPPPHPAIAHTSMAR